MSKVFVLDAHKRPLNPVHPGRARLLLTQGQAAVFRHYPFTLILKEAVHKPDSAPLRLKIDPGSKTTGLAIVNDATGEVVWAAALTHRGTAIKARLEARRALRRSRRHRKTRHRAPRFLNRRRPEAWPAPWAQPTRGRRLRGGPPPLESRVSNVTTWVGRLRRLRPIAALSMELAKFDTQLMQNPDIGVLYQQGELAGYEVREYLLQKWERTCAYCGTTGVPLQVEHIVPRSRDGSDRVSNLCIACGSCNQTKGNRTAAEFGHPEVQAGAQAPLKDAAAVNATRWAFFRRLSDSGLPLKTGTGGQTKFNRTRQGLPKTHWLDAACVGASTPLLHVGRISPLLITARGHGNRQMSRTARYGFPVRHLSRRKSYLGFRTGDLVRAVVPSGKHAGVHVGCVTIRQRPRVRIGGHDVHPRYLMRLQKADGYAYAR